MNLEVQQLIQPTQYYKDRSRRTTAIQILAVAAIISGSYFLGVYCASQHNPAPVFKHDARNVNTFRTFLGYGPKGGGFTPIKVQQGDRVGVKVYRNYGSLKRASLSSTLATTKTFIFASMSYPEAIEYLNTAQNGGRSYVEFCYSGKSLKDSQNKWDKCYKVFNLDKTPRGDGWKYGKCVKLDWNGKKFPFGTAEQTIKVHIKQIEGTCDIEAKIIE